MDNEKENREMYNSSKEAMVSTLIEWASINSGSNNFEGQEKILRAIKMRFSELDGDLELIAIGPDEYKPQALRIIKRPDAKFRVLLNGHMDTVYGEDSDFQDCEQEDNDKLKGPGVADMKGGLVVILYALKCLEESSLEDKVGWTVLITPDEEIGSLHSRNLIEETARECDIALIYEPTLPNGNFVRNRKGVGGFKIKCHGKSAHVGRDFEKGKNAIVYLSKVILELEKLNSELSDWIINIGKIEGGGATNVVPDYAEVELNVRISKSEDQSSFIGRLAEKVNLFKNSDYKVEYEGHFRRPAKLVSQKTEELFEEIKSVGKELGMEIDWEDTGGASDGNFIEEMGIACIDTMGVEGGKIHSPEEFINVQSLEEKARLSAKLLLKLSKEKLI